MTMRGLIPGALGLLAVAGCAAVQVPNTAVMPLTGAGTPVLSREGAIQTAAYTLGTTSRTEGHPAEAARALAAVDFLAGDFYASPHWTDFPAITKVQMVQGRAEMRGVLGIPPAAPSQLVVNGLIGAATALDAGNSAAAASALSGPAFSLGPQRTLAVLNDLPALPQANVAAQSANAWITVGCMEAQSC
jgi:hypothetical protein